MNDKKRIEKSPFYDEYTGTTKNTKTYGYHVRKDFEKTFKDFLKARFDADASDNEIMEEIVQYYYFSFAHERTYYPKTIVALISEQSIHKGNPTIIPMYVDDRFAKSDYGGIDFDKETRKTISMQFHVWIRRFKDAGTELQDRIVKQVFNDGFSLHGDRVFKMMNDADFNKDKFNDFFVLEIPLNNYLDVEQDGVYGYLKEDGVLKENQHCGVVVANANHEISGVEPFSIAFNWRLNADFSIDIIDIVKLSESNLARLISRYNEILVMFINPILNFNYSLEKKLEEKNRLIEDIEAMLEHEKEERLKLVDAIEHAKSKESEHELDMIKNAFVNGSDETGD